MDSANFQTFGKSAAITTLAVTKPAGQNDNQATSLVSFGKDPLAATEVTRGVGIYSSPYCMVAASSGSPTYNENFVSNCGLQPSTSGTPNTAVYTEKLSADEDGVRSALNPATLGNNLELVNAIEINWALPYGIPNDRT